MIGLQKKRPSEETIQALELVEWNFLHWNVQCCQKREPKIYALRNENWNWCIWVSREQLADAFTLNESTDISLGRINRLWDKMGPWIWLPVQLQAALVFFQVSEMLQKADTKELLTRRSLTLLDHRHLNKPSLWRGARFWSQWCKPGVVDFSEFQWDSSGKINV